MGSSAEQCHACAHSSHTAGAASPAQLHLEDHIWSVELRSVHTATQVCLQPAIYLMPRLRAEKPDSQMAIWHRLLRVKPLLSAPVRRLGALGEQRNSSQLVAKTFWVSSGQTTSYTQEKSV